MTDNAELGFGLGLSEAEKNDLESLIRAVQEDGAAPVVPSGEELERRWRNLNQRVGRLAAAVLEMDEKVRVLQEIARLSHRRSELLERYLDPPSGWVDGGPDGRTPS